MEGIYIFKMKDGTQLAVNEDTYKNHKFIIPGEIVVEEHWFDKQAAKNYYKKNNIH